MRRLCLGLLFLSSFPVAAKGLLVSPSRLWVTAAAGASIDETLVLTPATAERTRVTASIETFALDADGKPWRGPGSETPRSLTSLLDVEPRSLVMEDGKPVSLHVTLSPPARAGGSYWAAIALEVEPVETVGTNGSPIDVVTRLVVPVFVTVESGSPSRLEVEDVVARTAEDGTIEVTATIENTGSDAVRTVAFLTLEESGPGTGVEVATGQVTGLVLLPGFPRRIRGIVQTPPIAHRGLVANVLIAYGERLAEARAVVAP